MSARSINSHKLVDTLIAIKATHFYYSTYPTDVKIDTSNKNHLALADAVLMLGPYYIGGSRVQRRRVSYYAKKVFGNIYPATDVALWHRDPNGDGRPAR